MCGLARHKLAVSGGSATLPAAGDPGGLIDDLAGRDIVVGALWIAISGRSLRP